MMIQIAKCILNARQLKKIRAFVGFSLLVVIYVHMCGCICVCMHVYLCVLYSQCQRQVPLLGELFQYQIAADIVDLTKILK